MTGHKDYEYETKNDTIRRLAQACEEGHQAYKSAVARYDRLLDAANDAGAVASRALHDAIRKTNLCGPLTCAMIGSVRDCKCYAQWEKLEKPMCEAVRQHLAEAVEKISKEAIGGIKRRELG